MDIQGITQLIYNYTRSRTPTINTGFTPLHRPGNLVVSGAALLSEGHRFNPCNSQRIHRQSCTTQECPWQWGSFLIWWLLCDCFKKTARMLYSYLHSIVLIPYGLWFLSHLVQVDEVVQVAVMSLHLVPLFHFKTSVQLSPTVSDILNWKVVCLIMFISSASICCFPLNLAARNAINPRYCINDVLCVMCVSLFYAILAVWCASLLRVLPVSLSHLSNL